MLAARVRKGVIHLPMPVHSPIHGRVDRKPADPPSSLSPPRPSRVQARARARAIISRSFIRRSLTRASPLKITERAGAERREIKKEHEKHL